jgi:1-acyl-sn-glycerol-3-phosphate acyltransferase
MAIRAGVKDTGFLSHFRHFHPPLANDESLYHQTQATATSVDDLIRWRKLPPWTTAQKILQVIYFIVFGIVKIIVVVPYAVVGGALFILAVTLWQVMGSPEFVREWLKSCWSAMARVFLFLLGYHRITFHGSLDPAARCILANHTCFFDGFIFLPFGPRVMGKQEVRKLPVIRQMSNVYRYVEVDRDRHTGATKRLMESIEDTKQEPVMVFPEGASTNGDYMLKFHTGAFLHDLPMAPCVMRYTLYGTSRALANLSYLHHSAWGMLVFLGIPSIRGDVSWRDVVSFKTVAADGVAGPRQFADSVALTMANALGTRLIDLGSDAVFKQKQADAAARKAE